MIKQKIASVLLAFLTIPVFILEKDATSTIFILLFAVPMFFSKKEWFCWFLSHARGVQKDKLDVIANAIYTILFEKKFYKKEK